MSAETVRKLHEWQRAGQKGGTPAFAMFEKPLSAPQTAQPADPQRERTLAGVGVPRGDKGMQKLFNKRAAPAVSSVEQSPPEESLTLTELLTVLEEYPVRSQEVFMSAMHKIKTNGDVIEEALNKVCCTVMKNAASTSPAFLADPDTYKGPSLSDMSLALRGVLEEVFQSKPTLASYMTGHLSKALQNRGEIDCMHHRTNIIDVLAITDRWIREHAPRLV
ncbi:MAG: hypothetical protein WC654_06575 [Patescibacteria group bacterium]